MKTRNLKVTISLLLTACCLFIGQACQRPSEGAGLGGGLPFSVEIKGSQVDFDIDNFGQHLSGNGGGYGGMRTMFESEYGSLASQLDTSSLNFDRSYFHFGQASECNFPSPFEVVGSKITGIVTINQLHGDRFHHSVCDTYGSPLNKSVRIMAYNVGVAVIDRHLYKYYKTAPTEENDILKPIGYCSVPGWSSSSSPKVPLASTVRTGLDAIIFEKSNGKRYARIVIGKFDGAKFVRFVSANIPLSQTQISTPKQEIFSADGFQMIVPLKGALPRAGQINAVIDDEKISLLAECWRD